MTDPTLPEVLAEMRDKQERLAAVSPDTLQRWAAALEKYGPLARAAEVYARADEAEPEVAHPLLVDKMCAAALLAPKAKQ